MFRKRSLIFKVNGHHELETNVDSQYYYPSSQAYYNSNEHS